MPYSIEWSLDAAEDFSKLEHKIQERIRDKLVQASGNPAHFFERLTASSAFKLRVGDYRLIVRVFQHQNKILVQKVGHRKNVYEK